MGDKYYPKQEMTVTGTWTGRWAVSGVEGVTFAEYETAKDFAWMMNWSNTKRNESDTPC